MKIGKWLAEAKILGNISKIQTSPFTVSNKALSNKSRLNIRKNIDNFFKECTHVLTEYSMSEYPSDDIDFNLQFFKKLQTEYGELQRNNRVEHVASNEKRIEELRRVTPGHGEYSDVQSIRSTPSSAFMAGDNGVNKVKSILSTLKFANRPPHPVISDRTPTSSITTSSSSSNVITNAVVAEPSITNDVVDAKVQAEVIRLLKLRESYVSQEAFDSVQRTVEDYLGSFSSLNEANIFVLSINDFIPEDSSIIWLRKGVAKLLQQANFKFV